MNDRPRRDEPSSLQQIPSKANFVLHIIFCILLIIGLRVWHLAWIQHDKRVQEALVARKRTYIEPAARGTIRDRFNTLLAANKIEYRFAIVYSQFREIPVSTLEMGPDGMKMRRYVRREYIKKLSNKVAEVLGVDPDRLEDIIHSYGSQNYNIPLVIKKDLSEEQYFRLKFLEKDWRGILAQAVPKRYYSRSKVASDVIGYLGPISKEKYSGIVSEIRALSDYVKRKEQGEDIEVLPGFSSFQEAKRRRVLLNEQAYTINDSVGLVGIEASYESELRGYSGKRSFISDAKGNCLRELPGATPATPGKRVLLSLSIELQEFAEKLLAQAEFDREQETRGKKAKEPVMRGGAIVALDPKTGELLTLASFPRYDPNDFIRNKSSFFSEEPSLDLLRWLENESYFGKVWDQFLPLVRERYCEKSKGFVDIVEYVTWDRFLELILPANSDLVGTLDSSVPIKRVVELQQSPFSEPFEIDLSRLILSHHDFSSELLSKVGDLSIGQFRSLSCAYVQLCQEIYPHIRKRWKEKVFSQWRKEEEKSFLSAKRLAEKRDKIAPKPYLDYLDREEARQFEEFWSQRRIYLINAYLESEKLKANYIELASVLQELEVNERVEFLQCLRGFSDLKEPLFSTVGKNRRTLQDLVISLKKGYGEGSTRSFAFRHAAIQGSLFKLVTAYAGLKQRFEELKGQVSRKDLGLFEMVDRTYKNNGKNYVGAFSNGAPIGQIYKGGRIPKSLYSDLGRMELLKALEVSSNPYFSILAGDYLKDPLQLAQAAQDFGFGQKTGLRLPGEVAGQVPTDIAHNRTGLYSLAIGQHTLLTTPLQCASMLSTCANGGIVFTPRIVNLVVGKSHPSEKKEVHHEENFPYKQALGLIGIDFPLFTKAESEGAKNEVQVPEVKAPKQIFMPKEIQETLLEGLRRVIRHIHEDRTGALTRLALARPEQFLAFQELKGTLIGKTSTAESQEKIGIDIGQPSIIYNHTWFGGISYKDNEPELVVVVYLRYGGYGREAAPIASQIIKKWREIKNQRADLITK